MCGGGSEDLESVGVLCSEVGVRYSCRGVFGFRGVDGERGITDVVLDDVVEWSSAVSASYCNLRPCLNLIFSS